MLENMTRRAFVKIGGLVTAAGGLFSVTKTYEITSDKFPAKEFEDYPDFKNLFKKIDCTNQKLPITFPNFWENKVIVFGDYIPEEEMEMLGPEGILLKPCKVFGKTQKDLTWYANIAAANIILASGTDRNILVYDKNADSNDDNSKLVSLMYSINRRNSKSCIKTIQNKPITDVFFRDSHKSKFKSILNNKGIEFHPVPDNLWNYIERYYREDLKGTFAENKNNLVIGVTTSENLELIHPIFSLPKYNHKEDRYEQEYGIVVLNNERIILGAY